MDQHIYPSTSGKGTLSGMAAIVLWSASVGLIRSVSELLGKTGGAAAIFTVAGVLASVAVRGSRPWRLNRIYLLVGGLLFISYEILLALSLGLASSRAQALELGMINYMWPSLTIVLAVLTRQQRGSWLLLPGLALSLLGLVFTVKGDGGWSLQSFAGGMAANPVAYGFAAVAAILWAMYTVLTKRFGDGGNATPFFLLVTAIILWVLYAMGSEPAFHMTFYSGAQVFILGLFMSAAYSCWNFGIQRGNLTVLATASYFTPVLSILLASVWLNTPPSQGFWYGVFLVTAGSLVCWRSTLRLRPT